MAALAAVDDLELFAGPQVDPVRAARLIEMASAVAERWTRRSFARVVDDVCTVHVTDGQLTLPDAPVLTVASVLGPDGSQVDSGTYQLNRSELARHHGVWACGDYTVTYTHGFDPIPADVVAGVCTIAAGVLITPVDGLTQETKGPFSASYSHAGLVVGMDAAALLGPYRRQVRSVQMVR